MINLRPYMSEEAGCFTTTPGISIHDFRNSTDMSSDIENKANNLQFTIDEIQQCGSVNVHISCPLKWFDMTEYTYTDKIEY